MPQEVAASISWLTEATLATLLFSILYLSWKRRWFWDHYVSDLVKDRDEWKAMALGLLKTNNRLSQTTEKIVQQNAAVAEDFRQQP
jgi:hypothetical protein